MCDVIRKIDLNECDICKSKWPYQRFFKENKNGWNRELLHNQGKKCVDISKDNTSLRNLSLLVALRDEYGHSEFNEGHECRTKIRDKFYGYYIVDAEVEMLRNCMVTILFLCETYPEKMTKV